MVLDYDNVFQLTKYGPKILESNIKKIMKAFFNGPERGVLKNVSPAKLKSLRVSIVSAFVGISGAVISVAGMKATGATIFAVGFIGILVGVVLGLASSSGD